METPSLSLQELFFQGNYKDVLNQGLGNERGPLSDADLPFVVGALGFNGRVDESENLYLRRHQQLPRLSRTACRFFLGISFCRRGDYAKARAYIAQNLIEGRRSPDGIERFYVMQGLGFYRYFSARFSESLKSAEDALASATLAGFAYGMALASDLVGHSLIQTGKIHAGLSRLEISEQIAKGTGDGGLVSSIRISQITYRAQFGLNAHTSLQELQSAYSELDAQNSHAQANLLLEVANQHILRGSLSKAAQAMDEVSKLIYRSQHRRYGNLLSLRLAELAFRSGQTASALHTVRNIRRLLDERHDRVQLLMALGLEFKLLQFLELNELSLEILSELEWFTHRTARRISISIRNRQCGSLQAQTAHEDHVARILDQLRESPESAIEGILAAGYFGLLHEALGISQGASALVLGVATDPAHGCAILDKGEVVYRDVRISKQPRKLLSLLNRGPQSKANITDNLWGYTYHPLRHDSLIFSAVARLRELLGPYAYWIEVWGDGYRLRSGVKVMDRSPLRVPRENGPAKALTPVETFQLNPRQHEILNLFSKRRFVGVPDCLRKFKVSDMTLRRDFTALTRAGLIKRVGQARATRYELRVSGADATRNPQFVGRKSRSRRP